MGEKHVVVPDGSNPEDVDNLHEALHDVDWDGDSEGITIFVKARPGDTVVLSEDGGLRVIPKAK